MSETKVTSTEGAHHRVGLLTCEFGQINAPGVYIEIQTGTMVRIPEDALIPGRSPSLEVISNNPWVVTKISNDPYVPITKARMIAANLDLPTNF